jgi:hypothetical protein
MRYLPKVKYCSKEALVLIEGGTLASGVGTVTPIYALTGSFGWLFEEALPILPPIELDAAS